MHRAALLLVVASACHAAAPTQDPNVGAPTIVAEPVDKAVSPGQAATFLVRASGTGTLWYQWERNGVPLEAATAQVYATPPTAIGDDGATYDVVVKNPYGQVKSRAAKLSVHAGGPKTLTLHTTDGTGDAPFVAFQDGDGPWQSVDPDPHGDHAFTVTDERFGVVAGNHVLQGTVDEIEDVFLPPAMFDAPRHPVVATFAGIGADRAYVIGCQGDVLAPGGVLKCNLPPGANDILAVEDDNVAPVRYLLRRGAWVYDTGVSDVGLYDFGSLGAFTTESHILTIQGLPSLGYVALVEAGVRRRAGDEIVDTSFSYDAIERVPEPDGIFAAIRVMPAAYLVPGDVQQAVVVFNGALSTIAHADWFGATGDRTMDFPRDLASTTTIATLDPYPRVRLDWEPSPSLFLYTVEVQGWTCSVSRGWLGGGSTATYTFPDLSAVAGWDPAWAPGGPKVAVVLRGDSYVDVKRSLTFALYGKQVAPPPGDTTRSVTSIAGYGVTLLVP